ncbi:MAG: GspE/PulE family protein, partial [Desulfococcaceae bacterium]
TLHTNSAPESVVRLLDMGMDPFNFADAVLGIMAQRLGRTLCASCKDPYKPSQEEYAELKREYGEETFKRDLAEKYPYNDELTLYRPKGCPKCNNTGYRGRVGIHELMVATDDLKTLIQAKARVAELQKQALKDGMRTLKQDGIAKVFEGLTDFRQIRKVCIN